MVFQHDGGGDMSTGGKFLNEPGIYHCMVTSIDDRPLSKENKPIENAAFRVNFEVRAGTTPDQRGKVKDIVFFAPKLGGKDDGAFARKKMDRFFVAVGAMTEEQVLKKQSVSIELDKLESRQFFAEFQMDSDNKYVELAFAEIYHPDDPKVANVPRDEEALSILPKEARRIGQQPPQRSESPKKSPQQNPPETGGKSWGNI